MKCALCFHCLGFSFSNSLKYNWTISEVQLCGFTFPHFALHYASFSFVAISAKIPALFHGIQPVAHLHYDSQSVYRIDNHKMCTFYSTVKHYHWTFTEHHWTFPQIYSEFCFTQTSSLPSLFADCCYYTSTWATLIFENVSTYNFFLFFVFRLDWSL